MRAVPEATVKVGTGRVGYPALLRLCGGRLCGLAVHGDHYRLDSHPDGGTNAPAQRREYLSGAVRRPTAETSRR